jgi:hypothetical protein
VNAFTEGPIVAACKQNNLCFSVNLTHNFLRATLPSVLALRISTSLAHLSSP